VKVFVFYGLVYAVLLGISAWLISYAHDLEDECKQKGGVLVRTVGEGLKCFDKKPLD